MTERHELAAAEADAQDTIRIPNHKNLKLASWVWVKGDPDDDAEEDENGEVEVACWFGCITHIGSNFLKVEEPSGNHGNRYRTNGHGRGHARFY